MLYTTMFLGYACNRLGMYFNLLVWIGALESCGTFIRVVYGRMIYMSAPTSENTTVCKSSKTENCHAKRLKCSILIWNYGKDVNVPRSNRWRHLLRWPNAFAARDVKRTVTDCGIFFSTPFSCFLLAVWPHFLPADCVFTQYYTP